MKGVAFIVGLVLLGAAAHATIVSTGGYGSAHSIVTLAIAAGVAIAALVVGSAWLSRRRALAVWITLAIAAGEAFGLMSTAERLVAGREAAQAPLQSAAEAYAKAARRVADAAAAVAHAPTTSPRLASAIASKATADQASIDKSAERGCRENCRQLLQGQAEIAGREVAAARAELDQKAAAARAELDAARSTLADMKPPASATPLADRVGIAAWALDLFAAALGSIAVNGLAFGLIAFAGHRRREESTQAMPATAAAPLQADEISPPPTHDCVRGFAFDNLYPAAADHAVDVAEIRAAFRGWCAQRQISPPAGPDLGRAMGELFAKVGISVEKRDGRLMAIGVALKGEQAALPAPR